MTDGRPYSPGLEGVLAGETSLGYVDGEHGRLLYRGYRIGDLVEHGTYPAVANLLWTGEWEPGHHLPTGPLPGPVLGALRALPRTTKPMDALRTAVSAWGSTQSLEWPPTPDQARALTAFSPSALAAFARLRDGLEPVEPDPSLDLVPGFLYQLNGERPRARWTPTSSSAPSTASTPRRSPPGSSSRPAATSPRPSPVRSGP